MFSFKSVYFVIFSLVLWRTQAEISDKRYCADEKCSVLISEGKTLLKYNSIENNVLSFPINEDVKIFSYGAGQRPELIGVELRGKRGYVNKAHVRETRLIKEPKYLVDTELVQNKAAVPSENAASEINADVTQQHFEIVDGTRIPLDLTSTEVPVFGSGNKDSTIESTTYTSTYRTQPLDSVPKIPNVSQLTEPPITIESKTEESKKDSQPVEDDDDGDDNDDEGNDEEDIEVGEEDQEETDMNKHEKESHVQNYYEPSPNVTNDAPSNSEKVNEEIAKEGSENINIGTKEPDLPVSQNSENVNILDKLGNITATDPIQPAAPKAVENSANPEVNYEDSIGSQAETTKNIKQESDTLEAEVNETVPVINELSGSSAPPSDVVSPIIPSAPQEQAGVFVSAENIPVASGKEKTEDFVFEENNQSLPAQVDSSLPPTTTDIPIEFEALYPIDADSVTPNPLDLKSEQQSFSKESPSQENDLPDSLMPEFKEDLDKAQVKAEEPASGGLVNGLLSVFDTGDSIEPNSTDESKLITEEPNNVNHPEAEDEQKNLVTDDALEEVPVTIIENNEKSDAKFTAEIERSLQSESSSGFLSGLKSIFSFGSEVVNEVEENKEFEGPIGDLTDDSLDTARDVEVSENAFEKSDNPWSSNILTPQVNEELEVCDSRSEKCPLTVKQGFCDKENEDCPESHEKDITLLGTAFSKSYNLEDFQEFFIEAFSSDMFLYLVTTSLSVLVLIFIWIIMDKCRREGPLIARINKLEQLLLATSKENEMLQEKATLFVEEKTQLVVETVPNEVVDELNAKLAEMHQIKLALEDQIQALEKELDTSTEVGIELNKMISEMLSSTDGSQILKENVEQMQKNLLEQQDTISSLSETLNLRETESYELRLELEISNKKVTDLQSEVDKMVEKILRIQEERDQQHKSLESEIAVYKNKCKEALTQEHVLKSDIIALNQKVAELQRLADTKIKEYSTLKDSLKTLKSVNNDKNTLKSFLDVSELKAQLEQMKSENLKYSEQLSQEREKNISYTRQIQTLSQEVKELREKYENADKQKVEINTKLEVLNTYFKEKEDQMQKEISKFESLWAVKEGEATSTTERIRYMQEELQNYRTQNESLKQEIINQEVELKSQISVLEKKAHENWVANRQTERKLEEARQEAALLRNRLTLRERAIAEGHNQIRMQSPLHQNGELPISPPPIDSTQSPPPLFNPRDHMTKSPPIPGLPPPPFLPPPLGGTPFIPPPPLDGMMPPPLGDMGGMPHFIPGLHTGMFPGDHRPPPLGRMSSPPPVGGRYTPESTIYSEYDRYDRRSPSPPYDSEYGASPPPIRGFSPYNDRDRRDDRREYKRPQPRSNGRNSKGIHSSGSENDSLGKVTKKPQRKV